MAYFVLFGVVILLLIAILNAVRHGFNEVVRGLQAIHDLQMRTRSPSSHPGAQPHAGPTDET